VVALKITFKCGDLNFHYNNFRIEMDIDSENVDFIEKEVYACGDITDLDLEIKIEKLDEERNIKNEVFDEKNIMPSQFIGDKRKKKEKSNSENEKKKIKQEFEEKEEPQEIKDIRIGIDESNNQVNKNEVFLINHFFFFVYRAFEKICIICRLRIG
jgi:hypothetical protein